MIFLFFLQQQQKRLKIQKKQKASQIINEKGANINVDLEKFYFVSWDARNLNKKDQVNYQASFFLILFSIQNVLVPSIIFIESN